MFCLVCLMLQITFWACIQFRSHCFKASNLSFKLEFVWQWIIKVLCEHKTWTVSNVTNLLNYRLNYLTPLIISAICLHRQFNLPKHLEETKHLSASSAWHIVVFISNKSCNASFSALLPLMPQILHNCAKISSCAGTSAIQAKAVNASICAVFSSYALITSTLLATFFEPYHVCQWCLCSLREKKN